MIDMEDCGKIRYSDKSLALEAAKRFTDSNTAFIRYVYYRCEKCEGYHLTTNGKYREISKEVDKNSIFEDIVKRLRGKRKGDKVRKFRQKKGK